MDNTDTYTCDADGNRLTTTRDNGDDGTPDSLYAYTYDADGRQLTWAYDTGADGVWESRGVTT